jgi:hypothetical protein
VLTSLLLLFAAAPQAPDTVVVCPKEFVAALSPWLRHREAQGHTIEIVPNTKTPTQLRESIREIARSGKLRYVLLIGDADPRADHDSAFARACTPTHRAQAKVNVKWGSEPEIATDNWYADLDDDQTPELAIGRLTADNREELAVMVRKIIEYEQNADFGPWRRQVNFIAGVGGFGQLADSVLEGATKKFLTDGIPAAFQTSMTYGSWRSPFCPDPRRFHNATVERFNEGCLFWVYLGHGQRTLLDRIYVPGSAYHILDIDDVQKLDHGGRPPIAIFLSCYSGAFDGPHDCLGEELLRSGSGPVAVLSGSRVTMPYAMAILGNEMIRNYFSAHCDTLGEALLASKQKLAVAVEGDNNDPNSSSNRQLLDAVAKVISPDPGALDDERREHLLLFNLLGDPLLKLPHPGTVAIQLPENVYAGDSLQVSLQTELAGECTLDLVCRRDRLKETPPVREYYDGRDRILTAYDDVYQQANNGSWYSQRFQCQAGENQITFNVPADARGNCHVRAFVHGPKQYALGSVDVFIRKPLVAASVSELPKR